MGPLPPPTLPERSAAPWAGPVSVCCVFCCCVVRFKNGQGSNLDGGNYHVYENGSLEIKMIRKEDQGIYTCVATNILGKAENQVRLEVKGKGPAGGGGAELGKEAVFSRSSTWRAHTPDVQPRGDSHSASVCPPTAASWLGCWEHRAIISLAQMALGRGTYPHPLHRPPRNCMKSSRARWKGFGGYLLFGATHTRLPPFIQWDAIPATSLGRFNLEIVRVLRGRCWDNGQRTCQG